MPCEGSRFRGNTKTSPTQAMGFVKIGCFCYRNTWMTLFTLSIDKCSFFSISLNRLYLMHPKILIPVFING